MASSYMKYEIIFTLALLSFFRFIRLEGKNLVQDMVLFPARVEELNVV